MLDAVRERVGDEGMPRVFGRISFFVNAGVRFVEEHAKLRAMATMWERLGRDRYGVTDERLLRFRYGVQVNSLGLTESQPENNVQRIVLEALAVTLGRNARARSVQLPAWNEALGLPRPWDQQWSLRIQQVLAFETDLLEYPDLFEGSKVMDGLVAELIDGAEAELAIVDEHGGAVRGGRLHEGRARRLAPRAHPAHRVRRAGPRRRQPLRGRRALAARRGRRRRHPHGRPGARGPAARGGRRVAREPRPGGGRRGARRRSPRPPPATRTSWPRRSPPRARARRPASGPGRCAQAFGEFRAPTGVGEAAAGAAAEDLDALREEVERVGDALGRRPKILVGKPGLDGHSNGAEQIAVRARDIGMDVVYEGIRLTPSQIAASALQEGVHVVGLSILSGSHRELIPLVLDALRERGVDAPVVVGGIIPEADVAPLRAAGVAAVYTPEGLRSHAHHARHRGARRGAQRGEGGGLSRPVLDLRGAVPGAAPPAAPAARGLVLSESGLEAVPGWVAKLRQLRMLDLAHNDLALRARRPRRARPPRGAVPRRQPPRRGARRPCARSGRCGT